MKAKELSEFKKLTSKNTVPFFQFENQLSKAVKKHFERRQKEQETSVKQWIDDKIIDKLNYKALNLCSK